MSRYCERPRCVKHYIRCGELWLQDNGGSFSRVDKRRRSFVLGVRAARMFAKFMGGVVVHVLAATESEAGR